MTDTVQVHLERKDGGDPVIVKIPSSIWNGYSDIQKEAFKVMLVSPNRYLYRHRPPGDPQIYGQFSEKETQDVIARYKYFYEELKVGQLWGLFALPLTGRLGYQCANHIRKLITDGVITNHPYQRDENGTIKFGSVKDEERNVEAEERLTNEAREYLLQCLGKTHEILGPVRIDEKSGEKVSTKRKTATRRKRAKAPPDEPPPTVEKEDSSSYEFSTESGTSETSENEPEREPEKEVIHKPANRRSRLQSESDGYEYDPEDMDTPCRGAPDPLLGWQMTTPMMDPNTKLVMDRQSWIKVLVDGAVPPQKFAVPFGIPVKVTKHVFHRYRREICGVSF